MYRFAIMLDLGSRSMEDNNSPFACHCAKCQKHQLWKVTQNRRVYRPWAEKGQKLLDHLSALIHPSSQFSSFSFTSSFAFAFAPPRSHYQRRIPLHNHCSTNHGRESHGCTGQARSHDCGRRTCRTLLSSAFGADRCTEPCVRVSYCCQSTRYGPTSPPLSLFLSYYTVSHSSHVHTLFPFLSRARHDIGSQHSTCL
jgi:hypothetical protein